MAKITITQTVTIYKFRPPFIVSFEEYDKLRYVPKPPVPEKLEPGDRYLSPKEPSLIDNVLHKTGKVAGVLGQGALVTIGYSLMAAYAPIAAINGDLESWINKRRYEKIVEEFNLKVKEAALKSKNYTDFCELYSSLHNKYYQF